MSTNIYAEFSARLNDAFRRMRKAGLIARQNFSCCSTCGTFDLSRAVDEKAARGFAFFHRQDAERLAKGDTFVHVGYGAPNKGVAGTTEVGRLIADCARAAGLDVEWDGSPDTRVLIGLQPPVQLPEKKSRSAAERGGGRTIALTLALVLLLTGCGTKPGLEVVGFDAQTEKVVRDTAADLFSRVALDRLVTITAGDLPEDLGGHACLGCSHCRIVLNPHARVEYVLWHEFGHCVGLEHSAPATILGGGVMNPNGGTGNWYPGAEEEFVTQVRSEQ